VEHLEEAARYRPPAEKRVSPARGVA
jgi:hypothetical protein